MAADDAGPGARAPECQFCPFCSALAALREARPEAVEHLVKAGAELLLAARALLEGVTGPDGPPAPGRAKGRRRPRPASGDVAGNGLQRIDVG
ncbi:MAG TPA: hypothetical protein VG846_15000 [Actinomycetota bacterium]|nr:hypothetical protein [Actinomycetota bacterium]